MKRFFDGLVAFVLLLLLLPVLVVLAALVRWKIGRPVFFRQLRPGLNGQVFELIKFRTMDERRDARTGELLPDAERLGPLGRFLRRYSLDELPELWNVLVGKMSLVGPRPLMPEYLPLYNERQRRRHEVRPGITGWAQVQGRNLLTWEEQFELDVWYVENRSFGLDLRILWLTLWQVLQGKGAEAAGSVTRGPFTGGNTPAE